MASTREMLDEWRPLLCVFDVVMQKAISNMELFLPTIMPPEEHGQSFRSSVLYFTLSTSQHDIIGAGPPELQVCVVNISLRVCVFSGYGLMS